MADRGPVVLAVTAVMIGVSSFFVLLRFAARIFIIHRIKLDDWFILAAWILAFGLSLSICLAVRYGLGRHQVTVSSSDAEALERLEYTFSVLYNPALMATKTSIGIFYYTLCDTQPVFKWGNIGTMIVVNVAGLALSLLNIFQCRPLSAIFATPRPDNASCTDIITLYLSSAPVNIITDLLLLLLPLPLLKGMRLPKKQKIILYITFGFGIFITAVDIVRISYLQEATTNRLQSVLAGGDGGAYNDSRDDTDFSWYASLSFMWTAIEVNVGIMCASVPHLKPLVARFMPKMLKDSKTVPRNQNRQSVATLASSDLRAVQRVPSVANRIPQAAAQRDNGHTEDDQQRSHNDSGEMGFWDFLNATSSRRNSQDMERMRQPQSPSPANNTAPPPELLAFNETARRQSDGARPEEEEEDREMGFSEFLAVTSAQYEAAHGSAGNRGNGDTYVMTAPGRDDMPRVQRSETAMTNASYHAPAGTNFLDFMDMTEQKSIVFMSNRESFKSLAHVTFLFFIWGFAYGLLNVLNARVQLIAKFTPGQTTALHSVYYAGYFFGPLTLGRWVLKHWGFKACYIIGLMIYGTGTLIFWPAAVLTSFAAFLISNFIVGFGLSTLEVAANPFIALCGPPRYAEIRLNVSQAVQAIGSVCSPLLAQKALFNNTLDAPSLIDVQWTYLAISLSTFVLAYVYYAIDLPEVTNDELESASKSVHTNGRLEFLRRNHTILITLCLACWAQFLYVGAQEAVGTSVGDYLTFAEPVGYLSNQSSYQAIGHSLFAASRFMAAGANFFIKPGYLLLFFLLGTIIFSALAMTQTGTTAYAMVLLVYFFEGPIFSFVYAIALRGLGRYTKDGAVLITAAIAGGGILSPIQYAVQTGHGVQYSYCVMIAGFVSATVFPLYLSVYRHAREQTDPPGKDVEVLRPGQTITPRTTTEWLDGANDVDFNQEKATFSNNDGPRRGSSTEDSGHGEAAGEGELQDVGGLGKQG